jgi:protein subunit release factor A
MKTILIEIRSGEGGQDSKMLVEDMAGIYQKACSINNFTCEVKQ